MTWIDLPPLWLVAAIAAAWGLGRIDPWGLTFGASPAQSFVAGLLVGGGIVLALLALIEMRRRRTTPIPHREPDRLVTTGIFARSRNPIYLGDALILTGAILWLDAPLALPLIPVFLRVIERRFVLPEEDRLRRKFRTDWARYESRVRRWI